MRIYSADAYLLTTITPLHIGVGRTVGSVDLPIARDGFGYPYIPGSSIKGVVKSRCSLGKLLKEDRVPKECTIYYGVDIRGEISPSEGEVWLSPVSFTDAYLLLYPVRVEKYSDGDGATPAFAYATSELLISRFNDFVKSLGEIGHNMYEDLKIDINKDCGDLIINNVVIKSGKCRIGTIPSGRLKDLIKKLGTLNEELLEKSEVYVFNDENVFSEVVEAGIIRQTRIKLDYTRKTVISGALWSEEYVSQGAVFYFASIYRTVKTRNGIISADKAQSFNHKIMLNHNGEGVLIIGGKETIGKGLVKIKIIR